MADHDGATMKTSTRPTIMSERAGCHAQVLPSEQRIDALILITAATTTATLAALTAANLIKSRKER